ncbi:MAG: hypothetical protein CVU64_16750 [Deltaproteobacteria bacterium HGW-Deltaproteobacteria-21]|nr:MAG: hypothetical protein CVU64_16750 [Deltaproteobacteria bacterium HGW-Deltaproteobacteria-21]
MLRNDSFIEQVLCQGELKELNREGAKNAKFGFSSDGVAPSDEKPSIFLSDLASWRFKAFVSEAS